MLLLAKPAGEFANRRVDIPYWYPGGIVLVANICLLCSSLPIHHTKFFVFSFHYIVIIPESVIDGRNAPSKKMFYVRISHLMHGGCPYFASDKNNHSQEFHLQFFVSVIYFTTRHS
ncbi:hypothetical protein CEXT_813891 [Caerostris extrusa]|uniref:Uncharacterized protein n=1 Tax=Caerostris extrusa TaxID=172846 RepID=A0AAV4S400_CAEEX|nr:hypothetical protein CEXT_813891 [Caerostris extrusa]